MNYNMHQRSASLDGYCLLLDYYWIIGLLPLEIIVLELQRDFWRLFVIDYFNYYLNKDYLVIILCYCKP